MNNEMTEGVSDKNELTVEIVRRALKILNKTAKLESYNLYLWQGKWYTESELNAMNLFVDDNEPEIDNQ